MLRGHQALGPLTQLGVSLHLAGLPVVVFLYIWRLFFNKGLRGSGTCCGGERICGSGSGTLLVDTW